MSNQIIRQLTSELSSMSATVSASIIDDVLDWFDRIDDTGAVRTKMSERFAVGLVKDTAGFETYTRGEVDAAIGAGMYEAISTGIAPKIANALATLFTSSTQSWDYDDETTGEVIAEFRKAGGFKRAMSDCDFISAACESGVMHIGYANDKLTYTPIGPNLCHFVFPGHVMDGDETRLANHSDLDDAAVVVIQLDTSTPAGDATANTYRAYFGASDLYPNGRLVDYTASSWEQYPSGTNDSTVVYEYLDVSGEPANPLTLYRNSVQSDTFVPEYPIAILRGGVVRTSTSLLPVSTSLYESTVELELAWSRVLKDGLEALTGKVFVENPGNAPLPQPSGNWYALNQGQEVNFLSQDAAKAVSMSDVMKALVVGVANGYSVPDYQVISVSGTMDTSGVALAIKTKPLSDMRENRREINEPSIDRIFRIERGLINTLSGSQISDDATQTWNPGDITPPRNETEFLANLQAALDKGLISHLDSVRLYHGLATNEEAAAKVAEINASNEEFPAPQKQQQKPGLTAGRLPPRNPVQ